MANSRSPPLGFLAIDVILHRPPGDPFNQLTWPFPLIREKVAGSSESQVVSSSSYGPEFMDRLVDAGKRLAERGAVGIITSCGFLAMAQPELAACLPIPVATSALVQIPSILSLLAADRTVGIITFDDTRLQSLHLERLGINSARCHIRGSTAGGPLQRHIRNGEEYVHAQLARELVGVVEALLLDHPDIAAICLECTQMPAFADEISAAVGLPVYDVYTMGCWFYASLSRCRPERWGLPLNDTVEKRM